MIFSKINKYKYYQFYRYFAEKVMNHEKYLIEENGKPLELIFQY